ncbi:hypothetical protein ACEUCT_19745, partial [Aeromonas caviae]|uniref:hypothetical protein n=1 Tax=Aeromonas caviae TaxID=648 RepID=UPI0038CF8DB3
CMVFLLMGGAYLRSRIKQAGKWDQETIVSFFLCQYCSGEYLPLFLAQYPQNLSFERFQYLYMALDACFRLVEVKEAKKLQISHAGRVQWMCEKFGMPVPDWAKNSKTEPSSLSVARNDTFHEAIFFDGPLGFASYDGNLRSAEQENTLLQMEALVCRLLVAILGKPGVGYVKTSVNTIEIQALELRG